MTKRLKILLFPVRKYIIKVTLCEKCQNTVFFYFVNLRIQSEYGKIRTRKNSVFGHFSRSVKNINSVKVLTLFAHKIICTMYTTTYNNFKIFEQYNNSNLNSVLEKRIRIHVSAYGLNAGIHGHMAIYFQIQALN